MSLEIEHQGRVAVIAFHNPPVNALNDALRAELLAAVRALSANDDVDALVLWGGEGKFIAGADISEMNRPPAEPFLPTVVAALEACPKPVVAALGGATLGGGCEIALACDLRLAAPTARIGLTETKLGIIPGAGGTQRLPHLVGRAKAVELICGGQILKASEALALGVVDEIVTQNLYDVAIARARQAVKRKTSILPIPQDAPGEIDAASAKVRKVGKGAPAIDAAIELISAAGGEFNAGLARERSAFLTLRASPEAAALRYLFFAEREAAKVPGLEAVTPRPVQSVAVIGAGTMGAGIAAALLQAGLPVTLIERDEESAQMGAQRVRGLLARALETGRLQAEQIQLIATSDWQALSPVDLVIEAAFEDLVVKQEIFKKLTQFAKPQAVLATNTSYLDISAIAQARPEDVLGLHFFAPAHIMKLLEIVRTPATSPQALATAMALAKKLGKQMVVAGNKEGFIGNRVYAAYRRHAEYLLEDGAMPQEIDAAMEAYGMAMGIFAVSDISGLDIAYAMRRRQDATRDPAQRYVNIPDLLVEAGRLGRKTKAGWYAYGEAGKPIPDPFVAEIIAKARHQRGLTAQAFTPVAIQRRLLAVMAQEGALLLMEHVAQRASDIDVAFVNGYGFPRLKGGPLWAADQLGLDEVIAELERAGVTPAGLLRDLAGKKQKLSSWQQEGTTP